jgi:hypothetical protein
MSKDSLFTWFDDVFHGKVDAKVEGFEKEVKDTEIH